MEPEDDKNLTRNPCCFCVTFLSTSGDIWAPKMELFGRYLGLKTNICPKVNLLRLPHKMKVRTPFKKGAKLLVKKGDELKLVYPQDGLDPSNFLDLDFDVFSLQPMDGPEYNNNLEETLVYCRKHPEWRLSLQTHKYLQIP